MSAIHKRILVIVGAGLVVFLAITWARQLMLSQAAKKLRLSQEKIDAIYDYGRSLHSQGDYDKAVHSFRIIAGQEGTDGKKLEALLRLADIYEKQDQLEKARNVYRQIMDQYPSYENVGEVQKRFEDISMKLIFSPFPTDYSFQYVIKANDTLGKIAREFNTTVELLKRSNGLKNDIIIPGKTLKIPKGRFRILVDKSQNLLFLERDGEIIKTFTVSTGENNSTPVGTFKIEEKLASPLWYKIGAVVSPDSPDYELGTRWMGLSVSGYGIHGTRDEKTLGRQITKGCVRMMNRDVEDLFDIVPSGTEVVVVD
ncbi:MAG: L,D-transpeptidase family protein [Candidatus Omnitrophota bacterium]